MATPTNYVTIPTDPAYPPPRMTKYPITQASFHGLTLQRRQAIWHVYLMEYTPYGTFRTGLHRCNTCVAAGQLRCYRYKANTRRANGSHLGHSCAYSRFHTLQCNLVRVQHALSIPPIPFHELQWRQEVVDNMHAAARYARRQAIT